MWRKKRVYLDYAAGAEGNPSSPHEEGRRAKARLEGARARIAHLVECKSDDIIFTSGATESNALAILGLARPGAHFLYLPSAHASVVENMKLAKERGVEAEPLPIKDGRVDVGALRELLRPTTVLISMDAVCGETGTIWNTREVAHALARFAATPSARSAQAARPILHLAKGAPAPLLHVDASQAPMTEKLARSHYGADLLVFDSSKAGGPRGAGCLIAHRTIPLRALLGGGGQERGLRSGSESPELAAHFADALERAAGTREAFRARAEGARNTLLASVAAIPGLYINVGAAGAPHIVNLSFLNRDTDYLVALLDEAGFAVSTRSACETDSEEGSRAVLALTGDASRARSTLRVSWGPGVSTRGLRRFSEALRRSVAFVDSTSAK